MVPPPPDYCSLVKPSALSMDNPPPRPPPSMLFPMCSIPPPPPPPPVYTQPVMVPYGVPMQTMAPPPVTNIVIQSGGIGGTGVGGMNGGHPFSPLVCPKCKQGILIKQRNRCIKVSIIVLMVITFPFGLLLIPFLFCIWQNKCPVCLRVCGPPIGMKNSR
ncbi:hypothetical protein PENTCL1PPCAC_6794 [Pristionchus entomophagus]|uniref:Brain protein I3 n=1 Tax=Pristionchus entomophagus TaxID=358040 RepID=A0AAV5SNX8_9BILA|nr:hypothetical protein PENTCL1PPCAC_6794 [Pristionchus entomophagus]